MKMWKNRKIYTNFLAHGLTISKRSSWQLHCHKLEISHLI